MANKIKEIDRLKNRLYDLIKCYRSERKSDYMNKQVINTWIKQFKKRDRKFILKELNYILEDRYITRSDFKIFLEKTVFQELFSRSSETSGKKILQKTYFIRKQSEEKSQSVILKLLEEILQEKFKIGIDDCGKRKIKYIVYLDDILCTGSTLRKGLINDNGWLLEKSLSKKRTNLKFMEKKKIPLMLVFYSTHTKNYHKTLSRIKKEIKNSNICIKLVQKLEIDNREISSQFIHPQKNTPEKAVKKCRKQINHKIDKNYTDLKHELTENYYRNVGIPKKEKFFSSRKNRNRFEQIILKKCIEIYNKTSYKNIRIRPLGHGLYTDKSFGFGTLIFTWRNVPFNTPLVFWYKKDKVWHPLFERDYTEH